MTTNHPSFHNEASLAEAAEAFGKRALRLGLIPSFVIRYFPDSQQFYIPDEERSKALTPEQAYLHLKSLIESTNE